MPRGCSSRRRARAPRRRRRPGRARWSSTAGATAKKPSKKQRTIDRHLFTAQYYLLRENDLNAAAAEYRLVMKLDKGNVMAGMALADIEIQRKKPKGAIKVLEALGRKNKRDARVWRALAMAHKSAGSDKKMVAACKKALAIDPRDGEAHWLLFQRALEHHQRGDKSARAELEAAAKGYLASGYLNQGPQHKQVERTLIELSGDELALAVYDAKAAYTTAFAAGGIGSINQQMAEARRGFEKCVASAPDRQECHYYLGLVYGSVKSSDAYSPDKAKASLRKAPDMPEAHVELARLLRVEDDLGAAARELGVAIKLSPSLAVAHLELGIVRKLDGNEDAAVDSFVAAYEADRFSSTADRAVSELAKMRPRHPLVAGAMRFGDIKGDVFSTDRFKAAVKMVEEQLGGVDEAAPEKAVLEEILARLRKSGDVSSRFTFHVAVLKTEMVNAFALPDGSIYFTRGLFDFLKKKWPKRKLDASNDVLAHVMAHEMAHVFRRHTLQSLIYQEAIRDSSRPLDPAILTHVTRLHEVEADREGIVLAFLGGYHPRGGIEFMEVSGAEMEIPPHLDHPTYEERVHYLEEYWSNDVKFAFVSFRLGLDTLERAGKLELSDPAKAPEAYELAVDHFKRFRTTLKGNKEVLNNLGIAYAKLGVMSLASGAGSPLLRWQTRFSVERDAAIKYVSVQRDEEEPRTRGGEAKKKKAPAIPWQLREATAAFEEALHIDSRYGKAQLNLALVQLALGRTEEAHRRLVAMKVSGERDLLLGVTGAEQRKWSEAESALLRAARFKGLARAARFNLARMYQLSNRRDKARSAYQAYLAQDKTSPWARAAQKALGQLKTAAR